MRFASLVLAAALLAPAASFACGMPFEAPEETTLVADAKAKAAKLKAMMAKVDAALEVKVEVPVEAVKAEPATIETKQAIKVTKSVATR